jgi:hypothetical protein
MVDIYLPWKDNRVTIPDTYQLSLRRLESLLRRLQQDPKTLKEYDNIIQEQIARGIIERVDETSTTNASRVHYLPHHAIIRRDKKTTELRIVYDASAKSEGPSLNDCLYSGPSLAENIVDILVKKRFLMIAIAKEDRDVLRFLWVGDRTKDDPKIMIYRFTRVVFGVTASPFLWLARSWASHYVNAKAVRVVTESVRLYFGNCRHSFLIATRRRLESLCL